MHFARLNEAFGLAFHICNAVLSLCTFEKAKAAECIKARARNAFGQGLLLYAASVFTTKDQLLTQVDCGLWKEQAARMHFAHFKNAPEHVLPDSGSVSVLLQDAEHCSKRVFNSYSYFDAQKTHQKNRIRHEPA